jgi:hypothetical protein
MVPGMARQEFLMLADGAESTNGKIYILGGGASRHRATTFPTNLKADIAMGILVGWTETNERHEFAIRMEDEDGQVVANIESGFDIGRPAGAMPGQELRFLVAIKGPFPIPRAAAYKLAMTIDGEPQEPPFRFWVQEQEAGPRTARGTSS